MTIALRRLGAVRYHTHASNFNRGGDQSLTMTLIVEFGSRLPMTSFLLVQNFDFRFDLFIWVFYVTFNTVQVISRWVVGRAEEPVHIIGQGSVL